MRQARKAFFFEKKKQKAFVFRLHQETTHFCQYERRQNLAG